MKRKGTAAAQVYPLLLFGIIVVSLLFLVTSGAGLYSGIVQAQARSRAARAALSYLSAKVQAADAAGAVQLGEGPAGAALLLQEQVGKELYETRIYLYDGALREEYAPAAAPLHPDTAEQIQPLGQFELTRVGPRLLLVRTEYGQIHIALRSDSALQSGGAGDG